MARTTLILLKRGLESNRLSCVPQEGEPLYCVDSKVLYIGDGATPGGITLSLPVRELKGIEPIGPKDGINRIFLLPSTPLFLDSIAVYRNGVRQKMIASDQSFTNLDECRYNPTTNSIEFSDVGPNIDPSDWIYVDYTIRI